MLHLTVNIESGSGFCFGVTNAIQKAEQLLDKGEKVYCIGEIVHNDEEVARLSKKGLIVITSEDLNSISESIVLFRAHGEPPATYELAKKNKNTIIDASCPIVLKFQEKVKAAAQNNDNIYIFGKHRHPEIIALVGHSKQKAIIFENLEELKKLTLPKNITLYSQTTNDTAQFREIANHIISLGVQVNVKNTICKSVSNRKNELITFAKQHKKIIFVSGKNSSNGRTSYNICREANPASYFVSNGAEINPQWFEPYDTVGICGATSTPQWLMENIKQQLEEL